MESKICTNCITEKNIKNFHKKSTERKDCTSRRSSKLYYENIDKISNQQKTYYEKKREKLLQKQNERCTHFKSYLESMLN